MIQANTKKAPSPTYEVGYGKPPVNTRFRKGQSGHPGGRPKAKRLSEPRRSRCKKPIALSRFVRRQDRQNARCSSRSPQPDRPCG